MGKTLSKPRPPPAPSKMDLRESIATQTDVGLALSKQLLLTRAKDSNLVFSPLSIHIVLSLIAAGSAGPTQDQLLSFLRTKSTDHLHSFASQLVAVVLADGSAAGGPKLSFANGVWIDKSLPLRPSFKQVVDASYRAATNLVDFKTKVTSKVNAWAKKETSGLIKEVLPAGSVDGSTRLIFANALYFKGAWHDKFDASKTKHGDFFLLDGTSVQVPFMTSKNKQILEVGDGFKVLGLAYKQGEDKRRFSMYLFLPDARDGLLALVEKFTSESGFLDRHLPHEKVTVGQFRIPRFKVSFGFEASKDLRKLGLVLPFSSEGGLMEMVDSPEGRNLYVSSIFHKSFIEVNEEGTEAAAASAGVIITKGVDLPIDFVADHPFLFLVREDMTGTIPFLGQVLNPLAG
ncbi:serpin-ZX-like isoform X2 [Rhodamnia argentea]|uniref:Serpin-ZX-like isoform X2 n=1 Tax=Rhodamnia argentea TaxID=178133 RepID=A0ABM3H1F3_9MYRT|nr:serpin-ZX-like isoform X2 [Rhodamnia argentea]